MSSFYVSHGPGFHIGKGKPWKWHPFGNIALEKNMSATVETDGNLPILAIDAQALFYSFTLLQDYSWMLWLQKSLSSKLSSDVCQTKKQIKMSGQKNSRWFPILLKSHLHTSLFNRRLWKHIMKTPPTLQVHSSCKYHSHTGIRQGSGLSAYEPAQLRKQRKACTRKSQKGKCMAKWFVSKIRRPSKIHNNPRCELQVRKPCWIFGPKPLSCILLPLCCISHCWINLYDKDFSYLHVACI